MRLVIVGKGRVGRSLRRALRAADLDCGITSGLQPVQRTLKRADALVLAVPDGAIRETAVRIAGGLRPGSCVLHCAGSRAVEELDACRRAGAQIGAMHPMASFADARRPPDLRGTTFIISGDSAAVAAGRRIATAVGGRPIDAPIHGPAYHALAALVAGGSVGFAHAVIPGLEQLGLSRRDAERAAAGLIATVAANIAAVGLPRALTGPVIRGDADTVAAHREALAALSPRVAAAYDAVSPLVLDCAIAAGLDPATTRRMRKALRIART